MDFFNASGLEEYPHAPRDYTPLGDDVLKTLQDHIRSFHETTGMPIDSTNKALLLVDQLPMASIATYLKKIYNSQAKADIMLVKGQMPGSAELWKSDYNFLFPKFWKEFVEFLHDKYKPVIAQTKYAEFAKEGCWPPSTEDIQEFSDKYQSMPAVSSGRGRKSAPKADQSAHQKWMHVKRQARNLGSTLYDMNEKMESMDQESAEYEEMKEKFDTLSASHKILRAQEKEWKAKADVEKANGKRKADDSDDDDDNHEPNPSNVSDNESEQPPNVQEEEHGSDAPEEDAPEEDAPQDSEEDAPEEDAPPPPKRTTRHSQKSSQRDGSVALTNNNTPAKRMRN